MAVEGGGWATPLFIFVSNQYTKTMQFNLFPTNFTKKLGHIEQYELYKSITMGRFGGGGGCRGVLLSTGKWPKKEK